MYQSNASVDAVSGSLGPLYYTTVNVAGIPVEAMVDPGSSATIISFDLFKKVGHEAGIPKEALKPPDLVLRDYSQRPIPIGAKVNVTFEWQGRFVEATVYLRSDLGGGGEPCLLGTNVVIPLDLMTPAPGVEPRGGDVCLKEPMVQLIQAKRVPDGGATFIQARMPDTKLADPPIVFEPNRYWLKDSGLQVEESILHADKDGYLQVLVANPTTTRKNLLVEQLLAKLSLLSKHHQKTC